MTLRRNHRGIVLAVLAVSLAVAACGKVDNAVATAQTRIFEALRIQGIYERGNLPEPAPAPDQIKGWFDIVGGAYRHIVNEDRVNRGGREFEVARGDSISFMFDVRIFGSGNFDSQTTFYTNIEERIRELTGGNPDFDGRFWPTDPLKIKVGDDPRILKSLQEALISCRADDGDPSNDDLPGGIASDQVRVWLTPDLALGDRTVYNVPAGTTIVFEVTGIEIIKD